MILKNIKEVTGAESVNYKNGMFYLSFSVPYGEHKIKFSIKTRPFKDLISETLSRKEKIEKYLDWFSFKAKKRYGKKIIITASDNYVKIKLKYNTKEIRFSDELDLRRKVNQTKS